MEAVLSVDLKLELACFLILNVLIDLGRAEPFFWTSKDFDRFGRIALLAFFDLNG